MSAFNPICYICLKPLKKIGLNKMGFIKFKKCNCKKNETNNSKRI